MSGLINGKVLLSATVDIADKLDKDNHVTDTSDLKSIVNVKALTDVEDSLTTYIDAEITNLNDNLTTYIDSSISTIGDDLTTNYYTKTEVDSLINSVNSKLGDYYTKTEVDVLIPTTTSDLTNDSGFITLADVDLSDYYTKSESDAKYEPIISPKNTAFNLDKDSALDSNTETTLATSKAIYDLNQKIEALSANVSVKGRVDTIGDLPTTADVGDLYFVGLTTDTEKVEYIYFDSGWEQLGTTGVDLTPYLTKTEASTLYEEKITRSDAINGNSSTSVATEKAVGDLNADLTARIDMLETLISLLQAQVDGYQLSVDSDGLHSALDFYSPKAFDE